MLVKGTISKLLIDFVDKIKNVEQSNADQIIKAEAENTEKAIYKAIKSIQIVLPPGSIIVQGTGIATNAQPIILNNVIK